MPGSGPVGAHGRLLIDTALPFDSSSIALEFDSEDIVQSIPTINSDGIRGTRTHANERNRRGNETVRGSFTCKMSRLVFDNLLPAALGMVKTSDIFNVAETIPSFFMLIDKGVDIMMVSHAKISQMVITAQESQMVTVQFTIEAESATWGQTWPSTAPTPDATSPFYFSDMGTVSFRGKPRKPFQCSVTVDNVLSADHWSNQLTRSGLIFSTDRVVSNTLSVGATVDNSDLMSSTPVGEAISYVFTNAIGDIITIALGRVAFDVGSPTTNGKGFRVFQLTGQSRGHLHPGATGHIPDIRITNVAGS